MFMVLVSDRLVVDGEENGKLDEATDNHTA
jgi:hypothetical protein